LAESFNAHVRYGACFAVGIACAGTASKEATDLLQPLLEDQSDFVRQGALMSMALVLQQASEARSPAVKKFRDHLKTVVTDKHQPVITKSGAIIAAGILEAGGRNVVMSLRSRGGFMKMGGAVGVMMFLQSWYWYPLYHFLSLALSPTMLIGLNKDFDMPTNFEVRHALPTPSPPSHS
jgi:26S proteasome regulatory subunit N2